MVSDSFSLIPCQQNNQALREANSQKIMVMYRYVNKMLILQNDSGY